MNRILVVIVTFNGLKWLEKCLGSIAGADIFVVDNASSDGSADWVAGHYPDAILVRNTDNAGFTDANNLGMQYALDHGYDYVYLLNQDAWVMPDTFAKLTAAFEARPDYGILSPLQLRGDGTTMDFQFSKLYLKSRNDKGIRRVPRVMAAHWMIRCDALRRTGLFSDIFPIYGQDDNLCHRMKHEGFYTGIVPEATAIHDRAQRSEDKARLIYRNYYMGSLVRLHNPCIPRPLAWAYIIPFTFVKAVKYRSAEPFRYLGKLMKNN